MDFHPHHLSPKHHLLVDYELGSCSFQTSKYLVSERMSDIWLLRWSALFSLPVARAIMLDKVTRLDISFSWATSHLSLWIGHGRRNNRSGMLESTCLNTEWHCKVWDSSAMWFLCSHSASKTMGTWMPQTNERVTKLTGSQLRRLSKQALACPQTWDDCPKPTVSWLCYYNRRWHLDNEIPWNIWHRTETTALI